MDKRNAAKHMDSDTTMKDMMTEKDEFMQGIVQTVIYWQIAMKDHGYTAQQAMEGIGFTVCTMIDGSGSSFDVISPDNVKQDIHHEYYNPLLQATKLRWKLNQGTIQQ